MGFDSDSMRGTSQPGDPFPSAEDTTAGTDRSSVAGAVGAVGDNSNGSRALEDAELDSALQLLVERAQYITGATGTALALPRGDEMVCRASAGTSAPAVGARLQVRSGLTGESIARRQLLRCNNAETDPRVNLETCRELGIASIVVLPLVRSTGEVRGLFELFSDHPYAFEERDLVALERMADLTLTALDLAEQRQKSAPAAGPQREPEKSVEISSGLSSEVSSELVPGPLLGLSSGLSPGLSTASSAAEAPAVPLNITFNIPLNPEFAEPAVLPGESPVIPSPATGAVPEDMLLAQKCASCGFPVSEGRTRCLDCETKEREREERGAALDSVGDSAGDSAASTPEEFVPAFLANSAPAQGSWLTNPINLLAIVVLILGILVAIVVFR